MAVIVEERPGWRGRRREAFPEAVRCLAGNTMHGGMKNDPSEFAGAKPCIEPFEALEFVHDRVGTSPSMPCWSKRRLRRLTVSGWVPVSCARCVAVRSG